MSAHARPLGLQPLLPVFAFPAQHLERTLCIHRDPTCLAGKLLQSLQTTNFLLTLSGSGHSEGLTHVKHTKDNAGIQHRSTKSRINPPRPRLPSGGALSRGGRSVCKSWLPPRRHGGGWRAPLCGHPRCPLGAAALQGHRQQCPERSLPHPKHRYSPASFPTPYTTP